jgi:hypothetical protein
VWRSSVRVRIGRALDAGAHGIVVARIAVRASLRSVLERVTLQDVAANTLPDVVRELAAEPAARVASRADKPWRDSSASVATR